MSMTKGKIKAMQKAVLGMILGVAASTAQAKPILRHVQGLHGIEANAGITAIGKALAIEGSYYFSPCWQIKAAIGGEVDKFTDNAYRSIFTQPGLAYTIFTNYRNVFLNILGGANLHFECYRPKNQKQNCTNFNIGLALGGEIELFLIRRFEALLAGGARIFFLKSPYGKIDYFLSLGGRFSF